jgi:superfamily II DNA helicase RecQ
LLDNWGILYPHEFQIPAIHNIAFHCDQIIYLSAKTGSGKLAVLLTVGSIQTSVTVTMVPLVGLGSNQVKNRSNDNNLIKACHLDEHHGNDNKALRNWLMLLSDEEADHVSIFLYASPQSLQVGKFWHQCLSTITSHDMIRLIVIDVAHCVAQDGRHFYPEF